MNQSEQKVQTSPLDTPTIKEVIKKLQTTSRELYRDGVLYHIADLLSEAADKLDACDKAFTYIYAEKDVPEDIRTKLL